MENLPLFGRWESPLTGIGRGPERGAIAIRKLRGAQYVLETFWKRDAYVGIVLSMIHSQNYADQMRRRNKTSTAEAILRRSIATKNIEYIRNGSRYVAQMTKEGPGNRLPAGATIHEALSLLAISDGPPFWDKLNPLIGGGVIKSHYARMRLSCIFPGGGIYPDGSGVEIAGRGGGPIAQAREGRRLFLEFPMRVRSPSGPRQSRDRAPRP